MAKLGKQERVRRLKKHLATLKAGGSVSKRDMQSLLSDEQMQQYEDEWQNSQDYKQTIIDGRSELESYTEKLRVADAIWTRYENTKDANKKAKTENAALDAYGLALERLEELFYINPAIELYLDRPVSFEHGYEPDPSNGAVPRYKLSNSHQAITEQFETKSDVKMNVIVDAIKDFQQTEKRPRAAQNPATSAQILAKFRKYRRSV